MKKTLVLLAVAMSGVFYAGAQTTGKVNDEEETKSTVEKPSRDFVMIKLTSGGWADRPDSIKTKSLARGFALSIMYDFPIKKSNFSFAAGIGINAQNVYLDGQTINFKDTGSQAIFVTSAAYKRYKLTTTRLEMPLELRFFGNNHNRNTGFKAAIGANIGLTVGSHTKGVSGSGGSKFNDKVVTKRFIQQWDFAPTMRIGYGNFSLYGSYSLTPIFKENAGPQMVQYSVGICLTGL
jgi:hypothetical protein